MGSAADTAPPSDAQLRSSRICSEARLERLAEDGYFTRGCALILGLDAVRDAFGHRWGRRSDAVFELVFSDADRRLGPGDVVLRVSEVEVLIVSTRLEPLVFRGIAVKLLTQALKQLVGEVRPSDVSVRAATGWHKGQIVSRLLEPEELVNARIAAEALDRERRSSAPDGRLGDETALKVETITTFDGRKLDIGYVEEPVFDLSRSALAGYRVDPLLTHSASSAPLSAAERIGLLATDMERVDIATIDRALVRLKTRRDGGGEPPSLIVSISFLSASSQRVRTKLMLRPGPLRETVRASVIWALTDVPEGAPAGRLAEVAALIRPFGRAVFAETRLNGTAMKSARNAGVTGLLLRPQVAELSMTDAALWLLQAGRLAHRAAPALIASNLASEALLPMAAEAGFTHATVRPRPLALAA